MKSVKKLYSIFAILSILILIFSGVSCKFRGNEIAGTSPTSTETENPFMPVSTPSTTPTQPAQPTQTPQPSQPTQPAQNQPPLISSLTASKTQVYPQGTVEIKLMATDPDGDKINITWQCSGGSLFGADYSIQWVAPKEYGNYGVTVQVADDKGHSSQKSVTLSVVADQAPQITSLTANPATVNGGGQTTISCVATDPESDPITYTWKVTDGSVTGTGPIVTWTSPKAGGSYTIIVTLSDGKGAESKGSVSVTVTEVSKKITLEPIKDETGTIASDGNRDLTRNRTGDDEKNIGFRCFWSYNISSVNNYTVTSARLIFGTTRVVGDPFARDAFYIKNVQYSNNKGTLPQFSLTGSQLRNAPSTFTASPATIDVTGEIAPLTKSGMADRFQIEAMFDKITNDNGGAEWIEWTSTVTLEITYVDK